MVSPFFNGFVVRTVSSWVIGSSVWFVFGVQSWHIKYAWGYKALAGPPTSKLFTSNIPQIVWISSSLNWEKFHRSLIRFTIISWFRFQSAGSFLPLSDKRKSFHQNYISKFLYRTYEFHYGLPFHWFYSKISQKKFSASNILLLDERK